MQQFVDSVIVIVKSVERKLAAEIAELRQRLADVRHGVDGAPGQKGDPGKDVDPAIVDGLKAEITALRAEMQSLVAEHRTVKTVVLDEGDIRGFVRDDDVLAKSWSDQIDAAVAKAANAIPAPKDGQSVALSDVLGAVEPLIAAKVAEAVAAIPVPENGKPGPAGADGKSIDPAVVDVMVAAQVERAVAALPRAKDGTSVTVDEFVPVIEAQVSKAVAGLPRAKDGVGLTGGLIDKDGHLVLTLSDGTLTPLGRVVGADGADGGKGDRGEDGAPGRDGSWDQVKVERVSERVIRIVHKDGTPLEGGELKFTHPVFRDTYVDGKQYDEGDMVQWDGSGWIALKDGPTMKPGTGKPEVTGWKLWIKKGAEGKVGKAGPVGPVGPRGDLGPQGRSGY